MGNDFDINTGVDLSQSILGTYESYNLIIEGLDIPSEVIKSEWYRDISPIAENIKNL
jgi:hypothetical protein